MSQSVNPSIAPLERCQDWEHRLLAYIEDRATGPFKWGENDCALFAADWIKEATGVDLVEGLRGSYDSAIGAARTIQAIAGKDAGLAELIWHFTSKRDIEELSTPLLARRGDVVLIAHALCGDAGAPDPSAGPALGVVGSDGWHVYAPGPSGLAQATLKDCVKGWRI